MKQLFFAMPLIVLTIGSSSCQQNGTSHASEINDTVESASIDPSREPISLIPVVGSPEFLNAALTLRSANAIEIGKDSIKIDFAFDVKNYNLKNQTSDAGNKQCNNSDKGQHIHFIMDNAPYVALYEPKYSLSLPKNSEHYLMCFLSRSYHESIKTKGAAFVYHFRIDEQGKMIKLDEPTTPMVFYSRPKGAYLGDDSTNLLLDYYVWNGTLGNDLKVKASIKNENNGQSKELSMDSWQAMFIQHLGTGKSSISLSLTDKDGNAVAGPMTSVTREFQVAAQEPLQ
ncbi:MAG: hypothetical protein IT256_02945 [Chitinophagaceae bacterium]|nr:hypothetical protein [Chitinophagaceae bacterium]